MVQKPFVPSEFVRSVGQDLIGAFDSARMATTPVLVGDAMEKAVRDRLELILPRGIGVGSGCVIDTKGGTSRQMDIVLYEKEWCPVFCVNQNPATTYYPSEGVLAVGEIKSAIGKREFKDSFEKIASVKSLFRAFEKGDQNLYVGRKYGESGVGSAYGFHRDQTNLGDIFGFILAEKTNLKVTLPDPSKAHKSNPKAVLLGHYRENVTARNDDVLCPDLLVLLNGTVLSPATIPEGKPYLPTRTRRTLLHMILPQRAESPFGDLIKQIWRRYREGFTAHIPLETYWHYDSKIEPELTWAVIVPDESLKQTDLKKGEKIRMATPTDHLKNDYVLLSRRGN